ncbi:hypothetical protein IQ259_04945 [Fortiea sp. LEGE XX443]|uniref:hypothetical protein n=1 Tax=Fortiea sp. LEGE XX443 TaxID=1828611 RepID=UPI001882B976|nr:hypothetical protein [Fortiea sp. LEGE XX443]MBE9004393.1 hypothetical protein [Fortiea sp. LEGE XX443]
MGGAIAKPNKSLGNAIADIINVTAYIVNAIADIINVTAYIVNAIADIIDLIIRCRNTSYSTLKVPLFKGLFFKALFLLDGA